MSASWRQLLVLFLAVGAVSLWLLRAPVEAEWVFPMPAGKTYVAECGGCHTAFAPGLLPARSWRRMMGGLATHFGEDASLDEPQYFAVLKELETLAADGSYANPRMHRISAATPADAAPQRISETVYFKSLHDELPRGTWQRKGVGSAANCQACHARANQGRYLEREVRIPAAS
ncbi:MAG: diheme cytochrome c [Pseudomonadota bacterium]